MSDKQICPECGSTNTSKNGFANYWLARKKYKIQRYRCNNCGRVFQERNIRTKHG